MIELQREFPHRQFFLAEYMDFHSVLLLRSPRNESSKNIDVMFWGVEYLDLPHAFLNGLRLVPPSEADLKFVEGRIGPVPSGCTVFTLLSGGGRFYVVARRMRIMESTMEPAASPFHRGSRWLWHPKRTAIAEVKWRPSSEGGLDSPPQGPTFTARVHYEGQVPEEGGPAEEFVVESLGPAGETGVQTCRVYFLADRGLYSALDPGRRFRLVGSGGIIADGLVIRSEGESLSGEGGVPA